jgi:hypothetical protein
MKTLRFLALCGAAFLLTLLQSSAQELLIDQYAGNLGPPADVNAEELLVQYNTGTSLFTAVGGAEVGYTDPNGNPYTIDGGTFSITANINSSGNLSSGTLSISGTLAADPGAVLTANLMAGPQGSPAGSAPVGSAWDYLNYYDGGYDSTAIAFSFTVTGGTLAGDFGGAGAPGIIELTTTQSPFSLTGSYNDTDGTADVFPITIPEPSSTLLFLIGGGVWSVVRRCRRSLFRSAV